MQSALHFTTSSLTLLSPSKPLVSPLRSIPLRQTSRFSPIKATLVANNDTSTVDYSSTSSVFPAEACDTIGGEACDVNMYPEVKIKSEEKNKAETTSEYVDREYLEYNSPKTVFPGEACDDLGGEFCEPEYQSGVY